MEHAVKVTQFVSIAIAASGKTQTQIAQEVGFEHPNVISMIKNGETKLPFNRVSAFANAVGVPEKSLMSCALRDYMPETWAEIQRIYGFTDTEH